jgi:hypothetical protein
MDSFRIVDKPPWGSAPAGTERRFRTVRPSEKGLLDRLIIAPTLEELARDVPDYLTAFAHGPSIVVERATSSYSFRFSELSQPI